MKKLIISLFLIILTGLFTINHAYCEEDFFIDTNFQESKNKIKMPELPKALVDVSNETKEKAKRGWFFQKKDDGNKKITKFNYATNQEEEIPRGYYGTLPNIEADFKYKQQNQNSSRGRNLKIQDEDETLDEKNLKSAPFDDALFLDMVIKKDKTSTYVNDIQKTKFALNNLKKCIEQKENIQRFNACVNVIDMYVKNLKNKYQDKSESLKESYIDILLTNYYSKMLGNLKYDANYYSRYIPTSQGKYSKENIALEEEKLLNRINKTLFLINNES